MQSVFLIGAGGLSRELISWNEISVCPSLIIAGCFDDNLNAWDAYKIPDISIIGTLDEIEKYDDFVIAIMNGAIKRSISERMISLNKNIHSFIADHVMVGSRSILGCGVVLMPMVSISCDVKIGDFVLINNGSQIGHDVCIGDYSSIMANVDLGGGVEIGENVFIGSGTTILPGVKVAANCRIGAGSVVIKSIKKEGTYFGNPAKNIF